MRDAQGQERVNAAPVERALLGFPAALARDVHHDPAPAAHSDHRSRASEVPALTLLTAPRVEPDGAASPGERRAPFGLDDVAAVEIHQCRAVHGPERFTGRQPLAHVGTGEGALPRQRLLP